MKKNIFLSGLLIALFSGANAFAVDGICKATITVRDPITHSILDVRSVVERVHSSQNRTVASLCQGQILDRLVRLLGYPVCWEIEGMGYGLDVQISASGYLLNNRQYLFQSTEDDFISCPG